MVAPYSWCGISCCWPSLLTSPESFWGSFHKDSICRLLETSLFRDVQHLLWGGHAAAPGKVELLPKFWHHSSSGHCSPTTAAVHLYVSSVHPAALWNTRCHPTELFLGTAAPWPPLHHPSPLESSWCPKYWEIWWGGWRITPYCLYGGLTSVTLVW